MRKHFTVTILLLFVLFVQNGFAQRKNKKVRPKRKFPVIVSCGVCNQKAIFLPKPEYPKIAQAVNVSGLVNVEILIGKSGNVESAKAVSGHIFLRSEAVKAALKAKFNPLKISGKAAKFRTIIVYKFS